MNQKLSLLATQQQGIYSESIESFYKTQITVWFSQPSNWYFVSHTVDSLIIHVHSTVEYNI